MRSGTVKQCLVRAMARFAASVFPFKTLVLAEWLFADSAPNMVLDRPFFGQRLYLNITRSNAQRLLYLIGERFIAERTVLLRLLSPGMRVVDVGANIGYYSLFLQSIVGSAGEIVAVEPEPDNLIELRRNITCNSIENIHVLPIAAGAEDGNIRLEPGINGRVTAAQSGLNVPMRRLDSVLPTSIDLLKVDVEGYECEVLRGAAAVIRRDQPALFIEIHPSLIPPPDSAGRLLRQLASQYAHTEVLTPIHARSLFARARSRYFASHAVSKCSVEEMEAACLSRRRVEPFWAVCTGPLRPVADAEKLARR